MNKVWALLSTLILITGCSTAVPASSTLYQVSTLQALMQGVYDGHTSIGQLKTKGDLGLGTLNGLDGELVVLQGEFYQVRADGRAYRLDDQELTPFAAVVWFRPEISKEISKVKNYRQLTEELNALLPSRNLFYAIQIQGHFGYIKTRSVPQQYPPYPPLTEVVKDQIFFEFHEVQGTVVGFYSPEFTQNLQVPGYHLHFLTEDRTGGGHLLECQIAAALIQIDLIPKWEVELPQDETFKSKTFKPTSEAELHQVEK
ncbi:MAG: acetolactate decarboxylase [Desulfobacca sp.]|nr:acetolactate decarboxylase [Desulfobacca sp.]